MKKLLVTVFVLAAVNVFCANIYFGSSTSGSASYNYAANEKRLRFPRFGKIPDEARKHTRIELKYTLDAVAIAGRHRIAGHRQNVINAFHGKTKKKRFRCIDITVTACHVRQRLNSQLSR